MIGITDRNLGLGIVIENCRLEYDIGIWDFNWVLGIGIGDFDLGLGIGIGD